MTESKSDELTDSENVDSFESIKSDLGYYLSNNRGGAIAARPSAIEKELESFNYRQQAIDSAMAAMAWPSAIQAALESFNYRQQAIDSAMAAMARPSAIQKALESFNYRQQAIDSAMAAMANFPAMENTLASFAAAGSMMLRDPSSVSAIFSSIERSKFSSFELESLEVDLTTAAEKFDNAGSTASLSSVFANLSPQVQTIFIFIFLHILFPLVNSVSANLLTPVAESYLQDKNLTDREKVKEIKEIPAHFNHITTEGLRFITGNNVRLRSEPSTKAEIIDELLLGQIVTVLSKDRNWIEVTYTYDSGESMSGWVFTRYTAKFVR